MRSSTQFETPSYDKVDSTGKVWQSEELPTSTMKNKQQQQLQLYLGDDFADIVLSTQHTKGFFCGSCISFPYTTTKHPRRAQKRFELTIKGQ